ncbi:ABC transporter [Chelativorans salis]|uniref:ABC transporter n=1 Tax=Chelativorans salis TaxID=2978478 RepID=A0ABT2LKC7_9HYPH|nr:ABC transporter [Chelativorans sp. EGI FJ00035]MCT7374716.1 ABC transporter [Chelativorans sp. EGI FJ00035]
MNKILIVVGTAIAVAGLSGCIGKGKGKAPPPVAVSEPAPAPAPVYK